MAATTKSTTAKTTTKRAPAKKTTRKTTTKAAEPKPSTVKGVVISQPFIFKNSSGVKTGRMTVNAEGYEKNVNCFFNDPKSLHLFSFAEGDEIEIVIEESNGFLNGKPATPAGSVKDAVAAMEAADRAYEQANSYADKMDMLMGLYGHACATVENNVGFMESIEHLEEDYPDIHRNAIEKAAASIYIEFNRKGFTLGDIVPFE